jgi:aryl-alcohol dehydrogenase-like predicted oxidoreductase
VIDNSPARLRQDVEDSLRALRTDRIDLYLLHPADDESRTRP